VAPQPFYLRTTDLICPKSIYNTIASGGTFLVRIEDVDQSRARPEWEHQIYDDLNWLGLDWPEPVLRQSERADAYSDALNTLWDQGLLYPCTCNRRDIQAAISAPQEGVPLLGPDGLIYPGTCRSIKNSSDDCSKPYHNRRRHRARSKRHGYVLSFVCSP